MKNPSIIDDITVGGEAPSDFSKVVDILLNDEYRRRKTILGTNQVSTLTTLDVIAQIYDIPLLKDWVENYAEWRTSGDSGKGRQDIVEISKYHYAQAEDQRKELMGMLGKR